MQMFKRGGIDEVCSLLVLVAQEQADQQQQQQQQAASQPADPSMPGQHADNTADDTGVQTCCIAFMQDNVYDNWGTDMG